MLFDTSISSTDVITDVRWFIFFRLKNSAKISFHFQSICLMLTFDFECLTFAIKSQLMNNGYEKNAANFSFVLPKQNSYINEVFNFTGHQMVGSVFVFLVYILYGICCLSRILRPSLILSFGRSFLSNQLDRMKHQQKKFNYQVNQCK